MSKWGKIAENWAEYFVAFIESLGSLAAKPVALKKDKDLRNVKKSKSLSNPQHSRTMTQFLRLSDGRRTHPQFREHSMFYPRLSPV